MSHPMWVRGLKLMSFKNVILGTLVAPYVGAWIETRSARRVGNDILSHPMWVRGLKLSLRTTLG